MTQKFAAIIGAIFLTWQALVAANQIPQNEVTHWVGVVLTGVQILMTHLGFNRTPSGTVIPDTMKRAIDSGVASPKDLG